ncbi:MAG: sigma-E factor regulatory protein RseB domain-containing protein [Candidatus Acidoferrales bacterium]
MRSVLRAAIPLALLAAALVRIPGWSDPMALNPPAIKQETQKHLRAETIIQRSLEQNRQREQWLAGYQVSRHYHLENEVLENDSDMKVEVSYKSPDQLHFEILSQQGSGFVADRIWRRILEAEQEALKPLLKQRSAITLENYSFELRGEEMLAGRPAYVLAVTPKREDTFLFLGQIWIDQQDFALARAEGTMPKRPSFWIRKIEFVRTFKKVGPLWFAKRTEGTVEVLLLGTTWITITSGDYQIHLNSAGFFPPAGARRTAPPSHFGEARR